MIAAASAWLKTILFILLFAAFLELLLPSGQMRRFIRVIVGLFIMLAVLNPVLILFEPQTMPTLAAKLGSIRDEAGNESVVLPKGNAKDRYGTQFAKQIRAALLTINGVRDAEVTVQIEPVKDGESPTKIQRVTAVITGGGSRAIEPVTISGDSKSKNEISEELKEKIIRLIAELYQVPPQNIEVH